MNKAESVLAMVAAAGSISAAYNLGSAAEADNLANQSRHAQPQVVHYEASNDSQESYIAVGISAVIGVIAASGAITLHLRK